MNKSKIYIQIPEIVYCFCVQEPGPGITVHKRFYHFGVAAVDL